MELAKAGYNEAAAEFGLSSLPPPLLYSPQPPISQPPPLPNQMTKKCLALTRRGGRRGALTIVDWSYRVRTKWYKKKLRYTGYKD